MADGIAHGPSCPMVPEAPWPIGRRASIILIGHSSGCIWSVMADHSARPAMADFARGRWLMLMAKSREEGIADGRCRLMWPTGHAPKGLRVSAGVSIWVSVRGAVAAYPRAGLQSATRVSLKNPSNSTWLSVNLGEDRMSSQGGRGSGRWSSTRSAGYAFRGCGTRGMTTTTDQPSTPSRTDADL